MALHQYIGARYVPKFYENSLGTAEWVAGVIYEPLTIVTYNSNSYTSKKAVPANIGDPSSNPDYWVATGVYNQQVADLSNRVDAIENEIVGIGEPPVNIMTLGAKNDGSEDVSAIINQYTSQFPLYFPAGIYRLDSPCIIRKSIIGALAALRGSQTVFYINHTGTGFEIDPINQYEEIVLKEFTLDGLEMATGGIDFRPTVKSYIAVNYVNVYHVHGIAININPSVSTSRCARISNIMLFGPNDLSGYAGAYNQLIGIVISATAPDSVIDHAQIMIYPRALVSASILRATNIHAYCACGASISNLNDWYSVSIGMDFSANFLGDNIYIDSCQQGIVQRVGVAEIGTFIYWDDGNFASLPAQSIPVSTRGTAKIHIGTGTVGGDYRSIQEITSSLAERAVTFQHLNIQFAAAYYSDLSRPRKVPIIGFNEDAPVFHLRRLNLSSGAYHELLRITGEASALIRVNIGFGSGITDVTFRRSGGAWTITKNSETFPVSLYYKIDGNMVIILFYVAGSSLEASAIITGIGTGISGIMDTPECENFPYYSTTDVNELTPLT